MAVRQYIGARYVPVFADDVQWDIDNTYDPLTMVQNSGETFMSRQYVPAGIELPDTGNGQESNDYWVHMSNWNAQVEGYREEVLRYAQEVLAFDGRIDDIEDALPSSAFDSTNTVDARFDAIEEILPLSDFDSTNTVDARFDTIEADAWVTAIRIAADAVTTAKILDANVTTAKIADGAVTTSKLAAESVTNAKIADGTIQPSKIAKEVIVIFGDSWSDPDVADVNWPEKLQDLFGDAEIHNYAKNGCRSSNGTFQTMYQAFINDDSFDKSTITRCLLIYGVNDYFTTPIDSSSEANAIAAFGNTILPELPAKVPVHWFINCCYGKHNKDAVNQIEYWHRVMLNVTEPRIIPHEMWSWFNVSQWNDSNYFHLKQSVYNGFFVKNIYTVITGGEPLRLLTYNGAIGSSPAINVIFDIKEDSVECTQFWPAQANLINYNLVATSAPIPVETSVALTFPTPMGGFGTYLSGSSDAVNINRITFLASAPDSSIAANRNFQNTFYHYPIY